ncbi:MAG: ferrous iron transport protein A [Saprospiraceae bacterium]|nr:ferrous iron transport protein A [Saprospiraceae bacterium]
MKNKRTLSSLKPGESAYVEVLDECSFTCKFMNLGILPKTRVTLVRKSPFGGAYYIKLGNYQLAVRTEEAETIYLEDIS